MELIISDENKNAHLLNDMDVLKNVMVLYISENENLTKLLRKYGGTNEQL